MEEAGEDDGGSEEWLDSFVSSGDLEVPACGESSITTSGESSFTTSEGGFWVSAEVAAVTEVDGILIGSTGDWAGRVAGNVTLRGNPVL